MTFTFTYQQDSLKEISPFRNLNHKQETAEITYLPLKTVVNNENTARGEAVPVAEKTGFVAMSRKNVLQREQNLLVGNSRFIEPRNDLQLVAAVAEKKELHLPERPFNSQGYDWITLILLLALALFASVKTTWGKYMNSLFHSTINYPTALRMFQEKNNSLLQGAFQLDVLFYLIFSVFFFQVLHFFSVDFPFQHIELYLFCLALVLTYFIGKKAIYRFIGILIEKKGETSEFLFNSDNFKRVTGLILIPMVAVIAFYPYYQEHVPLITGVVIVGLIYSLLILRGFKILLKKQFSIFYLILYFCTLELLPLVLLYKILVV